MELPGRLVLLGHPVSHSLSPAFQNAALRSAGFPLAYEALDVAPANLASVARLLTGERAAGNVTVPHKEAFVACCTTLSPVARHVGAVNTFWVEDGALVGDNTDVGGFDSAVRSTVGLPAAPFAVAVIGAGGAARAVAAAVERWHGATARIWSRTAARAGQLADRFARTRAVAGLEEAVRGASLVVNATPLGLGGGERHPVPPALLDADARAFDLAYRRGGTPWVVACRARGLAASDGLPMLLEQGALSFERWFARAPDREAMHKAVR
ncbi:MAG: hypothetical protein IT356_11490 [Gemmatimonadaceae bacterium]|nr:hypothetical protein [Gemmatimonadaceae bacterium]